MSGVALKTEGVQEDWNLYVRLCWKLSHIGRCVGDGGCGVLGVALETETAEEDDKFRCARGGACGVFGVALDTEAVKCRVFRWERRLWSVGRCVGEEGC